MILFFIMEQIDTLKSNNSANNYLYTKKPSGDSGGRGK